MDEIIPGLWIGNLPSALDHETLQANKIFSILSAMRGKVSIHETFIKHQILLDDTEEADILQHFLPSISFIQAELNKGRGVLVHCQAGMSRSVAIVAAYLMYERKLTPDEALELIRKSRPDVDPNPGFLTQLQIFHDASYKISGRDKNTRMFYLERTVEEVLNGDGSIPSTDMFAKFPQTPTASTPATPGGGFKGPRRRIRCKMCRQELAAREHMLDHGQLGPATPASATPAASRRPSTNQHMNPLVRHPSISMTSTSPAASNGQVQPISTHPSMTKARSPSSPPDTRPRRSSLLALGGSSLAMSPMNQEGSNQTASDDKEKKKEAPTPTSESTSANVQRRPSGGSGAALRPFANISRTMMDSLSMSALESSDEDEDEPGKEKTPIRRHGSSSNPDESIQLGRRMSDAMKGPTPLISPLGDEAPPAVSNARAAPPPKLDSPYFANPNDLAAQLHANPKLAALRSPVSITPSGIAPLTGSPTALSPAAETPAPVSKAASAPIIMNPKCSGYFVEPMKWMEPFLEEGQIAGKIVCPNKKCGAKLGNYDWAGVCCGCKEWAVPGFCINRNKVDEVVH
ncbi:tyrosine protein phosphatase yvh1 [Marasmius crinis-equi]|uniref:protein-tyrosine-phosphatase n=1 Tax=Marasmius crinis-equi TaxID=585013 RepID=A0ABR3FM18_9AGAR